MAPGILTSGYSCTCQVTTQNYQGWYVGPTGCNPSVDVLLPKLGHKRYVQFCFAHLQILCSGGSQRCAEDTALWRGFMGQGTEASCQRPASCEETLWEAEPLVPVKPSHDCIPANISTAASWDTRPTITQLSCSWIPNPMKWWGKYYFKLINLGAICHEITCLYNKMTQSPKDIWFILRLLEVSDSDEKRVKTKQNNNNKIKEWKHIQTLTNM